MEQIITLQIHREDRTPANEYDWHEILKLKEGESVHVIDHVMIRTGTVPPDCPNTCKKSNCNSKCKKSLPPFYGESNS